MRPKRRILKGDMLQEFGVYAVCINEIGFYRAQGLQLTETGVAQELFRNYNLTKAYDKVEAEHYRYILERRGRQQ